MSDRARNADATPDNCPFGEQHDVNPLLTICRRFPPVFIGSIEEDDGTTSNSWAFPLCIVCGEHPEFLIKDLLHGR